MSASSGPAWSRFGEAATSEADARVARLIEARFEDIMRTWPSHATYLGIHEHDGRLADLSRAAKEADISADRRFLAELEAADGSLSPAWAFELELAAHATRLRLFEAEVQRGWQRRLSATDEIGDALFLLLARDFAPLEERLHSMTQRLEAVPTALAQVRDRLAEHPVRLWNELEVEAARDLPLLFEEIVAAGRETWPEGGPELRRLEAAASAGSAALEGYATWLTGRLGGADGAIPLGAADLDTLLGLRALDGLDSEAILAIGLEQLEVQHEARREAGRAIDPDAAEEQIVERVKSEGPADFETALRAYREAMLRAREHIERHGLATLPEDESLEVLPTPTFMRRTMPLAAYFEPAVFDRPIRGVYIVTPSVGDDPRGMREHNWASIVNTSVHEAYPGHHQQFSAALSSATPARLLLDAPEFSEGWAMYCEQMMLEEGFEDTPERRVIVATDAIWRACRIVLDIRLQRGEVSVPEAIDFLVRHTGFERSVARAEVHRYTYTPGYNLSYLLGKVLLLRLRSAEQRRLGGAFSLRAFHDALLYSGSLPVSFHRRLLAGEGGGPTGPRATVQASRAG